MQKNSRTGSGAMRRASRMGFGRQSRLTGRRRDSLRWRACLGNPDRAPPASDHDASDNEREAERMIEVKPFANKEHREERPEHRNQKHVQAAPRRTEKLD